MGHYYTMLRAGGVRKDVALRVSSLRSCLYAVKFLVS